MSWDVLLQKFPDDAARPEDVPDDYLPPAVGSRADVAAAVRKLLRSVEVADESFITVQRARFAIEISLGDDEPCSQLLLHVHDDHAAATPTIFRIAEHFGMRAIDCSSSKFLEAGQREQRRKHQGRSRRTSDETAMSAAPPLAYLSGVAVVSCNRVVYLSFLAGESPQRLQNAVFRYWVQLGNEHGDFDAGISGPSYVLTLPGGEPFGDIRVSRFPVLVTETEAEMIPRVQKGAALVHAYAAATGRRSGEIENGTTFVLGDGQRIPLAQCTYQKLVTDADYSRKIKAKKKA